MQPSKLQYAGEGVVYLSQDPVEFTSRSQLLIAEYKAGNRTTRNEIVAITDELQRKTYYWFWTVYSSEFLFVLKYKMLYYIYNDYQTQNKRKDMVELGCLIL